MHCLTLCWTYKESYIDSLLSLISMKTKHPSKFSKLRNVTVCWRLTTLFLLSCMVGCTEQSNPLSLQSLPQRLIEVNGATLDRIPLEQGNVVYLQTINLHKMEIDQLIGDIDQRKGDKGFYYPSKNNNDSSPFFKRLTATAVRNRYQSQHPSGIFSIINASLSQHAS
jgi:hypothetical protein